MQKLMKVRCLTLVLCFFACSMQMVLAQLPLRNANNAGIGSSQGMEDEQEKANRTTWGRDTTKRKKAKKIPVGQFQWRVDRRLGTVIDAENNDTVVHNFQNFNNTEGYTGHYNILGNVGSPRESRVFMEREQGDDFLFVKPFSFFRTALQDFRFTNTLSPVTNLAYHKCGNNQNGEDRVRAYFASNINKLSGLGLKLDYLYGRGYYNSQANSMFGSTFYGYHRGERYNIHAYININDMKMGENGGIEDDNYIRNPQSFQQKYSSKDIPVMLSQTWNRNHEQNFYLTHRYNLGFYRDIEVPDSLKPTPPSESELLMALSDSLQQVLREDSVARQVMVDSLMRKWESQLVTPQEFVPVTSIIHTFDARRLSHNYAAHSTPDSYYTNHYYGQWNDVLDKTRSLAVRNTVGVALKEGFNKWAQMGITLFGTHEVRNYRMVDWQTERDTVGQRKYVENDISVGGEIARTQGKLIHYNVNGEIWLVGERSGDFAVDGNIDLGVRMGRKDSLAVNVHAYVKHQTPDFYFRHYHSQSAWWDNSLDRELRTRIEGSLRLCKFGTRVNVGFENVANYTYFGMQNTLKDSTKVGGIIPGDYSRAVAVRQTSGSVQVFSATLAQDLKFGPVHWDSEVTYQKSSDKVALPLPDVTLYTNVYLLFRLAKVLRVQLGGDLRYFTSYYAPDYSTSVGQFAVQDNQNARVKIGNYPIVNVYANLHLKHCRLYVAMNHVNQGTGHAFWAPHYPINPRTFHFGVSWNFFN